MAALINKDKACTNFINEKIKFFPLLFFQNKLVILINFIYYFII